MDVASRTNGVRLTLSEAMTLLIVVSVVLAMIVGLRPGVDAELENTHLLRRTAQAIERYRQEYGRYPARLDDLDEPGRDAWGRPFVYRVLPPRDGRPFDLISLGADGAWGGHGEDADMHAESPALAVRALKARHSRVPQP